MITFEAFKNHILPITLRHEGGYVNDPDDRGGETYRGISRRANPSWKGWELLQKHLPLKRGDIVNDRGLAVAVAEVYWGKYFEANQFNHINSLVVALQLFDFAVNGGYSKARLQTLLNQEFDKCLLVDNVIGAKTLEAINACNPIALSSAILNWRQQRFEAIIARDSTQAKFEKGWSNRLNYLRHVKELINDNAATV